LPVPALDAATIEAALAQFRGRQQQVPPMYSALKRNGRPLYELARQGIEVDRPSRTIEIHRLTLVEQAPDLLRLECECAKGTYIRVLGEDLARALGTVGHLSALRRTWVQPFKGMPMCTLETVLDAERRADALLPPDTALTALPQAHLTADECRALVHGQAVRSAAVAPRAEVGRRVRLYGPEGVFLGLAEARPEGWLQPRRLLRTSAT
jgi:tRNA pseudouridine55 synthase